MEGYNRDQLVSLAKLCEQTERYEDMKEAMKKVIEIKSTKLETEERNLLSVAYKNVVGARRSAWRALNNTLQTKKDFDEKVVTSLMEKVFGELKSYSEEIIKLLDENVLSNDIYLDTSKEKWFEDVVFYYKMKGDYLRYVAEVLVGSADEKKKYTDNAEAAYLDAKKVADENLGCTSSIRLGLVLNFSVFYYEISEKMDKAIDLAEKAFEDAVAQMESELDGNEFKDSALILQLLRDNLTLWKSNQDGEDDD